MLNEKKNVYAFLIKKPLILYAGLGSKQKNFQRVSRNLSKNSVFLIKELCFLFEKSGIFSYSKRTDRLDPPPPLPSRFRLIFKDPFPNNTTNVLFE